MGNFARVLYFTVCNKNKQFATFDQVKRAEKRNTAQQFATHLNRKMPHFLRGGQCSKACQSHHKIPGHGAVSRGLFGFAGAPWGNYGEFCSGIVEKSPEKLQKRQKNYGNITLPTKKAPRPKPGGVRCAARARGWVTCRARR